MGNNYIQGGAESDRLKSSVQMNGDAELMTDPPRFQNSGAGYLHCTQI